MRTSLVTLAVLCILVLGAARARALDTGVQEAMEKFAARIVAVSGQGPVRLRLKNSSSATAEQFTAWTKALEKKLAEAGVRVRRSPEPVLEIRATLSENAGGMIYLAEVQRVSQSGLGSSSENNSEINVVVVEAGRVEASSSTGSAMSLRRSLLVSRSEPVLDAAMLRTAGENRLVLLTSNAVILYRQTGGRWMEEAGAGIAHTGAFPLDVRGKLVQTGEGSLDAYLPGNVCSISVSDGLHAECREADDAWPLGGQAAFFNTGRNYFNGLLRPGFGKQEAPFFSAAALPFPRYTLWIFSGTDGRIRMHDGLRESTLSVRDWGSDVAAVHSGCGSGTQLVVTGSGDASVNDGLRAFEMVERQPVLAMPAMDFAGAITALWPAADGTSVMAVVRNSRTAGYEVFNVSIGCNQ